MHNGPRHRAGTADAIGTPPVLRAVIGLAVGIAVGVVLALLLPRRGAVGR